MHHSWFPGQEETKIIQHCKSQRECMQSWRGGVSEAGFAFACFEILRFVLCIQSKLQIFCHSHFVILSVLEDRRFLVSSDKRKWLLMQIPFRAFPSSHPTVEYQQKNQNKQQKLQLDGLTRVLSLDVDSALWWRRYSLMWKNGAKISPFAEPLFLMCSGSPSATVFTISETFVWIRWVLPRAHLEMRPFEDVNFKKKTHKLFNILFMKNPTILHDQHLHPFLTSITVNCSFKKKNQFKHFSVIFLFLTNDQIVSSKLSCCLFVLLFTECRD